MLFGEALPSIKSTSQTKHKMFKKGLCYYLGRLFVFFLFLHALVYIPFLVFLLCGYLAEVLKINIELSYLPEIVSTYIGTCVYLFGRTDLGYYMPLMTLLYVLLVSNKIVQNRKKK
jgi:hypothetical protein